MSSTLTNLTAATTWSGTDLFYALVGGNSRKIAASKFLVGEAAGVLSAVDSTTAQTFRVYRTFTDASNYERLALQSGSGYVELAAETAGTGTDNINVSLKPAGTGGILINYATNLAPEAAATKFQSVVSGDYWTGVFAAYRGSAAGSAVAFFHSRNTTPGSFTTLQNGDEVSSWAFYGDDGSTWKKAADMVVEVAAAPSTGVMPGRFVFKLSPAGSASPEEMLKIDRPATATQTALQIYDVDNNTVERVTVGIADSGGSGFKLLRIPN